MVQVVLLSRKEIEAGGIEVIPTVAAGDATPIISMYRVMDATTGAADGQMAANWMGSARPATNFDVAAIGIRIGTPGAATDAVETPADTRG